MKKTILLLTLILGMSSIAENISIKLALNMYANNRAWQKGDILTILIDESTAATKANGSTTSKASSMAMATPIVTGDINSARDPKVSLSNGDITAVLANILGKIPGISYGNSSSFTGSGSATSGETLKMNFAARVVDVLQNGNLVIRGDRTLIMQEESVNLIVTGLIRPMDVSSTNTIESTKIADAHIQYKSAGTVTTASSPGWFHKFIEFINPF